MSATFSLSLSLSLSLTHTHTHTHTRARARARTELLFLQWCRRITKKVMQLFSMLYSQNVKIVV